MEKIKASAYQKHKVKQQLKKYFTDSELKEQGLQIRQKRNKKDCILDAKKYKTVRDWEKANPNAVQWARKMKIMDACTSHMSSLRTNWTLKILLDFLKIKKYKNFSEWAKKSSGSYNKAMENGWLPEAAKIVPNKRNRYMRVEDIKENAKKYTRISDWTQNGNNVYYRRALKLGIVKEMTLHMQRISKITKEVVNLDTGEIFFSIESASKSVKVRAQGISGVLRGVKKTAGGFRWAYLEHKNV